MSKQRGDWSHSGDTNTVTIRSSYNYCKTITIENIEFAHAMNVVESVREIEAEAVSGAERLMLEALSKHIA